jgi:TolB-like protein/DNA-binding winged helix-turn-helix (wHTH) protein/Tfp pilus assembly protein PilF
MSQAPAVTPHLEPGATEQPRALRFGIFELDLSTLELRKAGVLVKLQQQPARVLALLALRGDTLVTREEIQREVWGPETFVDFEQGLNFCIRQIRSALADNADSPRFVETLPRRGYRFVAPVETIPTPLDSATETESVAPGSVRPSRRRPSLLVLAPAVLLLAAGAWLSGAARPPALAPVPGTPSKVMLAILPFENLSGDPSREYLSDGLTEELITQLARVSPDRLGVIARTSAMKYKGVPRGVDEIGRELGVEYLVEGSVRHGDGRFRVTAQLIQVKDQTHVWAQSYEGAASDALDLESETAGRITTQLVDHLLTTGPGVTARAGTKNLLAYDAWLKGRYHLAESSEASLRRAVAEFEQAVALDPDYAVAQASLAEAWVSLGDQLLVPSKEAYPRAKAAAEAALTRDARLAEAWVWLGVAKAYYEWDLEGGRQAFDRALALNPGLAIAHHYYADYLCAVGRREEALASVKRAQVLDPLSRPVNEDVGWYAYFARHYPDAARAFLRTSDLDPDKALPHAYAAVAFGAARDWPHAAAQAHAAMRLAKRSPAEIERVLGAGGEAAFRAFARDVLTSRQKSRGPVPAFAAGYYAYLGDREGALADLEYAQRERWRYLLVTAAADPDLDALRGEPRFQAVLSRLGLAPRRRLG